MADSRLTDWLDGGGNLQRSRGQRKALTILYPYIHGRKVKQLRMGAVLSLAGVFLLSCAYLYNLFGLSGNLGNFSSRVATPTSSTIYLEDLTQKSITPITDKLTLASLPTLPPEVTYTPSFTPTATQTPTSTPSPTFTPSPTLVCSRCTRSMPIEIRLGWFYPPLGGSHCPTGIENCTSAPLTSGQDWFSWLGQVAACPAEFPLHSVVEINGLGAYECVHRLAVAQCDFASNVCDVLVLSPSALVEDWLTVYPAILWLP